MKCHKLLSIATNQQKEARMNEHITTGSVFDDLNLDPGKAEQMKIKALPGTGFTVNGSSTIPSRQYMQG